VIVATAPVDVRSLPRVEVTDSGWQIFAALASVAVAAATTALAYNTYLLAKESRLGRAAEELRHMNSFLPHLALQARETLEEDGSAGDVLVLQSRRLALYVRNIGAGFAKNIIVTDDSDAAAPGLVKHDAPVALGVGEEALLAVHDVDTPAELRGYRVVYEDAFGRTFETVAPGTIVLGTRYTWRQLT
jgi:hypothetical protein